MTQHIYGSHPLEIDENRPNLFIKELNLYVDYFKKELNAVGEMTKQEAKKWNKFKTNLLEGIEYYKNLFAKHQLFGQFNNDNLNRLDLLEIQLGDIEIV